MGNKYLSEWTSLHKKAACAHPQNVSPAARARRKINAFSSSVSSASKEKLIKPADTSIIFSQLRRRSNVKEQEVYRDKSHNRIKSYNGFDGNRTTSDHLIDSTFQSKMTAEKLGILFIGGKEEFIYK